MKFKQIGKTKTLNESSYSESLLKNFIIDYVMEYKPFIGGVSLDGFNGDTPAEQHKFSSMDNAKSYCEKAFKRYYNSRSEYDVVAFITPADKNTGIVVLYDGRKWYFSGDDE